MSGEPLRIWVGSDESQWVATKVLEHSCRSRSSVAIAFEPMTAAGLPLPKDAANRPRTGFSFCRFTIPERAGFRGRALYLDADMLVLGDLAELARLPFGAQKVLCTCQPQPPEAWRHLAEFQPGRQFSVMLLDCERLPWRIAEIVRDLDEGRRSYAKLMFDLDLVAPDEIADRIPPEWNHLERCVPGATKLVHFTVVSTQPWRKAGNPLGDLWYRELAAAVAAGAVTRSDLELGVRKGHLLPRLLRHAPQFAHAPLGRVVDALANGLVRARALLRRL